MKKILLLVFGFMLVWGGVGVAAEKGDAKAELKDLVSRINNKLAQGQRSPQDLAGDLRQFDALLAEHQGEKTDEVAQILFMEALLYAQVLNDPDKASDLVRKLKADFPETTQGKRAEAMLASLERQAAAGKIQKALAVGKTFPDFAGKDFEGNPLSVARFKGKVVLIDFWATWCGPCVGEFPNVLRTYQQLHPKGFEIIGISLDSDRQALANFIRERGVAWPQYFDGKRWTNSLAVKYGVMSIPASYLLDGQGRILAKDLRGEALPAAVEKALVKP
ncbi:MAG: TlpA family protein disulfide reductase [Verrucomicrobia bacterium]|nr:TlpA family protein disulfide reductase [Verrucomicrobiota bacterium]